MPRITKCQKCVWMSQASSAVFKSLSRRCFAPQPSLRSDWESSEEWQAFITQPTQWTHTYWHSSSLQGFPHLFHAQIRCLCDDLFGHVNKTQPDCAGLKHYPWFVRLFAGDVSWLFDSMGLQIIIFVIVVLFMSLCWPTDTGSVASYVVALWLT